MEDNPSDSVNTIDEINFQAILLLCLFREEGFRNVYSTFHGSLPPASKETVKSLQTHLIEITNDRQQHIICVICNSFNNTDDDTQIEDNSSKDDNPRNCVIFKILPCKHSFHDSCITNWLNISNTCPMCRFELKTDNKTYERWKSAWYKAGEDH